MIDDIEYYSKVLMSPDEIELVLQSPGLAFKIRTTGTDENLAFERGTLKRKAAVNNSIVEMAQRGSAPAQQLLSKLEKEYIANQIRANG